MKTLASFNPGKLIDLLTERLTFERTGVELYDKVIDELRAAGDPEAKTMLGKMQEFRNEEKEHEEWLEEQIRDLGGDAHGKTEMSSLVERESMGIADVVMKDDDIPHALHALLTAELSDNAGWELLVQLALEADDEDARRAFGRRLHEEEDHLLFLRKAMEKLAVRDVLGEDAKLPKRSPLDLNPLR